MTQGKKIPISCRSFGGGLVGKKWGEAVDSDKRYLTRLGKEPKFEIPRLTDGRTSSEGDEKSESSGSERGRI